MAKPEGKKRLRKKSDVLTFKVPGRPLDGQAAIEAEFRLMKAELKPAARSPTAFERMAANCGTHLLKATQPQADALQNVLRFAASGANAAPELVPSGDARNAPPAKVAFRPLEVVGHPTRTLADHLLNPDAASPAVAAAFAKAFGQAELAALQRGLAAPPSPVTELPAANFPVVFVLRPGGTGDLQVSPVPPARALAGFGDEVQAPYFQKAVPDGPRPPRGRWHRQAVTAHVQNVSAMLAELGPSRRRFLATFPKMQTVDDASLHRLAKGGGFPRLRDDGVAERVRGYAKLSERHGGYSNKDIRDGLDCRADELVAAARDFVEGVLERLRAAHPEAPEPEAPSPAAVLMGALGAGDEDRDRARAALWGDHFRKRAGR